MDIIPGVIEPLWCNLKMNAMEAKKRTSHRRYPLVVYKATYPPLSNNH